MNLSSSTKAAKKNPNIEVIGIATPKEGFKLEHIKGSEERSSVLLFQENDERITEILKNNSDEIARYERSISINNLAQYISSNNKDDQERFNKAEEEYDNCKESLADNTNELYNQLPSRTLAESLIRSANDLGEVQLKYLASLKSIDFFMIPCLCIRKDVEIAIKEEVIKEVKDINSRNKVDLRNKKDIILNEIKAAKEAGYSAPQEDVFMGVFDKQTEVLTNFKNFYSSENNPLLHKTMLIPKFSRFAVEFTKKLMLDYDVN